MRGAEAGLLKVSSFSWAELSNLAPGALGSFAAGRELRLEVGVLTHLCPEPGSGRVSGAWRSGARWLPQPRPSAPGHPSGCRAAPETPRRPGSAPQLPTPRSCPPGAIDRDSEGPLQPTPELRVRGRLRLPSATTSHKRLREIFQSVFGCGHC